MAAVASSCLLPWHANFLYFLSQGHKLSLPSFSICALMIRKFWTISCFSQASVKAIFRYRSCHWSLPTVVATVSHFDCMQGGIYYFLRTFMTLWLQHSRKYYGLSSRCLWKSTIDSKFFSPRDICLTYKLPLPTQWFLMIISGFLRTYLKLNVHLLYFTWLHHQVHHSIVIST